MLHIFTLPLGFLYKYSTESTKRNKWYFKLPFSYIDNLLRLWDFVSAQRPDFIVANSKEVQKRVKKFYKRESTVIYPPVQTDIAQNYERDNVAKPYYVAIGRLIRYKNFDLLIQAFNLVGLPLVIIGTGEYETKLKQMAGPNVTFKGVLSEEEKGQILHNALGLINPISDEDFGIVPVEAMAHGIPVLAHKSGGHLETIIEDVNGMFFDNTNIDDFVTKVKSFDSAIRNGHFDKEKIRASVQRFSKQRFQTEFKQFVEDKWENFCSQK